MNRRKIENNKRESHWKELFLPVLIISVIRISGYLYMFVDPIVGILVSFFFDIIDSWILYMFGVPYKGYYHSIDKRLDYLQYIIMIPLVVRYPIFPYFIAVLIYRTIGDLLVYITGKRYYFLFFPNFVEYIVLIFLVIDRYSLPVKWDNPYIITALIAIKLVQEGVLHIFGKDKSYLTCFKYLPQLRKPSSEIEYSSLFGKDSK
jgi:hypothetical protein